jgi:hypothetical protein
VGWVGNNCLLDLNKMIYTWALKSGPVAEVYWSSGKQLGECENNFGSDF